MTSTASCSLKSENQPCFKVVTSLSMAVSSWSSFTASTITLISGSVPEGVVNSTLITKKITHRRHLVGNAPLICADLSISGEFTSFCGTGVRQTLARRLARARQRQYLQGTIIPSPVRVSFGSKIWLMAHHPDYCLSDASAP